MKLYVMRHGPAEDTSSTGLDADRTLTGAGRSRVRRVAEELLKAGELPLEILSSPLVRAVETAEIVAEVTQLLARAETGEPAHSSRLHGTVEIRGELGMGADKLGLLAELVRTGRERVMIVGHEPDLSMLLMSLVGHVSPGGMQTAMVAGVTLTPDRDVAPLSFRATRCFELEPRTLTWSRATPA